MKLNSDQLVIISAALDVAKGNFAAAARYLNEAWPDAGWTKQSILKAVEEHDALRQRWIGVDENEQAMPIPEAVTDLDRPDHIDNADEVVEAMQRQEMDLRHLLRKLNYRDEELETIVAARDIQQMYSASTLAILGGGILSVFLDLKSDFSDVRKEIERKNDKGKTDLTLEREMGLRKDRIALVQQMQGCYEKAVKAAFLELEIQRTLKGKRDKSRSKPALGVTAIPIG